MPIRRIKGERGAIWTSTWFATLPKGFQRVGISLYPPKAVKGEHWKVQALAPGRWYNTVPPDMYLKLYGKDSRTGEPTGHRGCVVRHRAEPGHVLL
jgi:hypothetical protein